MTLPEARVSTGHGVHDQQAEGLTPFLASLGRYLPPNQVDFFEKAYLFSEEAHAGQKRLSGEAYINHPLQVALILAELHVDAKTLAAAVLHDVIEDTPVTRAELEVRFGSDVAHLVDGVSKLTQISFPTHAEAQAENFRKMLLAMVDDIRVILIKLADRLHNMRTLGSMPDAKRRLIAAETLEIYAPIAHRLGMNAWRLELEDLGFINLYPRRYRVLSARLRERRRHRKELIRRTETALKRAFEQENIEVVLTGREKHLYSIYYKMKHKGLTWNEVWDRYGFRIIVDREDTAYRALGVVHHLYSPLPGKFKDYIAIPKVNGYQSLHTVVIGPEGVPIEIQIRTRIMDQIAEAGIAAHWLYKTGEEAARSTEFRAREWIRDLVEIQDRTGSSVEFMENVKVDLFPDEVYVFTPRGEIRRLPRGSTPVDFAYAVHTDLGNSCVAAKIDRQLVPLRTILQSGQLVEILTARGARPNPAWLNFVVTAKARTNIRQFLKNLERAEARRLGEQLVNQILAKAHTSLHRMDSQRLENLAQSFKLEDVETLLVQIGLGERPAMLVAHAVLQSPTIEVTPSLTTPIVIRGTEGVVMTFARCCYPIPGDEIAGFLSVGRGMVIHRNDCPNLLEHHKSADKWVELEWEPGLNRDFSVAFRVDVTNERGALAQIAAEIAECGSNIEQVAVTERDGLIATLNFTCTVRDRKHLAALFRHLHRVTVVSRISRVRT